ASLAARGGRGGRRGTPGGTLRRRLRAHDGLLAGAGGAGAGGGAAARRWWARAARRGGPPQRPVRRPRGARQEPRMRGRARRPQRLPQARGGEMGWGTLGDRGPRVHKWGEGERAQGGPRPARAWR